MIGALFWISSPSIIHGWKSTKLDCLRPSAPRTMQKHSALVRTSMDFDSAVKANDMPRRPLINLDQLWHLAVTWYENRLTVESRRPAAEEMVKIFESVGLAGPFWDPQNRP